MADVVPLDPQEIVRRLREHALNDRVRVTLHAHQEMVEEDISYQSLREALLKCTILENYPDHQRGPCCLVCGQATSGRYLHVVCTTTLAVIVIITAYEPKSPKWNTPLKRGGKHEM